METNGGSGEQRDLFQGRLNVAKRPMQHHSHFHRLPASTREAKCMRDPVLELLTRYHPRLYIAGLSLVLSTTYSTSHAFVLLAVSPSDGLHPQIGLDEVPQLFHRDQLKREEIQQQNDDAG